MGHLIRLNRLIFNSIIPFNNGPLRIEIQTTKMRFFAPKNPTDALTTMFHPCVCGGGGHNEPISSYNINLTVNFLPSNSIFTCYQDSGAELHAILLFL